MLAVEYYVKRTRWQMIYSRLRSNDSSLLWDIFRTIKSGRYAAEGTQIGEIGSFRVQRLSR